MRIQHNISAMNTQRQLGVNNTNTSKSLEKLSSGYRINRAGDDAAGLAISEKMRAQIRGLNRASENAQDGVSLIQAAEGALQETHSILQRMRELAVQAANDVNELEDRDAIQAELDSLTAEVDRIANTTEFNKKTLLDGSLSANLMARAVSGGGLSGIYLATSSSLVEGTQYLVTTTAAVKQEDTIQITAAAKAGDLMQITAADGTVRTLIFQADETDADSTAAALQAFMSREFGNDYTINVSTDTVTIIAKEGGEQTNAALAINITQGTGGALAATAANVNAGVNATASVDGNAATSGDGKHFAYNGLNFTVDNTGVANAEVLLVGKGSELTLQVGANTGSNQTIAVAIDSLSAISLGVNALDVSTHLKSQDAIDSIESAIQKVSEQRAALGAVQNRLEHVVANLDTVSENLQSAEARLRDVDMAKEMMEFTKNNILMQAAQAMLAQANALPQGVLQLLQ